MVSFSVRGIFVWFFFWIVAEMCLANKKWQMFCTHSLKYHSFRWKQLTFAMRQVHQRRSKVFAWISVILIGGRHKRWSHAKCSPIRWHQHNRLKRNRFKLMVLQIGCAMVNHALITFVYFFCIRSNLHRHSNGWTVVRTMARNIFINSVTIWSRIYKAFFKFTHRISNQWSKYTRNRTFIDATSPSYAKCCTTKSAEMVYNWCIKLLCFVARSYSRQC